MVLQRLRNQMVISSDAMAAKIGLGSSSYRMIEAGSAVLQPGKALMIIKNFERIEFEPLCKILVAIQIMEAGIDTIEDMRTVSSLIGEIDPGLRALYDKFEPLWKILPHAESSAVADEIRARNLDGELERYLCTPAPVVVDAEGLLDAHVKSLLSTTPPFYFDLALDLLDNFQGYAPRVSPKELARWEEKNKSRIVRIIGVLRDPQSLTDPGNFELFDHSFLWEPQFETMQIILLSPSRQDVLKAFKAHLGAHMEKQHKRYAHRLSRFDEALAKIDIRSGHHLRKRIEEVMTHDAMRMNNLWFYRLNNGNVVAFADNSSPDAPASQIYFGTSLPYTETTRKFKDVEKFWQELNDPQPQR